MQAIDAFTFVTDIAAQHIKSLSEQDPEAARIEEAVSIMDRIKCAALPIARFDCMVSIEGIGAKSKLGLGDYTICSTTISGIKNGLVGLSMEPLTVYIRLWERLAEGAEMLSGYQGETKTLKFRNFLADMDRFFVERNSHQVIVNNAS